MTAPQTAMVLAAGLGTRMRPLTDDRPKALVEVGGRALIDHMLDRLAEAGVTRAVVNVHAFADRLEAHLATWGGAPQIVISDERGRLLETGGGLKAAASLLGCEPIFTANIDAVWVERGEPALAALAAGFDPTRMDACLLVTPTDRASGLDGPGDFFMDDERRLSFRGEAARAPYAFCGVQVFKPELAAAEPDEVFSTSRIWRRLAAEGRLFGVELQGDWMHVGDPAARAVAEARLRTSAAESYSLFRVGEAGVRRDRGGVPSANVRRAGSGVMDPILYNLENRLPLPDLVGETLPAPQEEREAA